MAETKGAISLSAWFEQKTREDVDKITFAEFIAQVLACNPSNSAKPEHQRASHMNVRVIEPLRRAICGVSGVITKGALERYAEKVLGSSAASFSDVLSAVESHLMSKLLEGFAAAPALDDKLRVLVQSLKVGTLEGTAAPLDDETRIVDQLRDAGDTFLVISKVPTKVLKDRFQRMGWSEADAERVSFAIYKKKRPVLPVVVVTKTKMEAAESAVEDQDTTVDISGCGLEKDQVERFAAKLETAPLAVTTLDASANTFHKNGADAVCRMSKAAANLREFSIAGNNMQAPGVIAAVKSVAAHNPKLTRLDISNNFLTTEGAQAGLVDAFSRTNAQLSWLGLAGNELGQAPGGEVCAGLIALGKLRTLVLNGNKLGAGGIAKMAPAIKSDRSLQHLYLESNDLRDDDVLQLAETLQFHPAITSLHVRGNPLIGTMGYAALAKLVKLNSGLVQLSYDEESPHKETGLASAIDFNKKKLLSIHHKMVREGGADVSAAGLSLWLRMMGMSTDVIDHLREMEVDGNSIWHVSGTLLDQSNKKLSEPAKDALFSMLQMVYHR